MGTEMTGIPRNVRESHIDGRHCCGVTKGMETDAVEPVGMGFLQECSSDFY